MLQELTVELLELLQGCGCATSSLVCRCSCTLLLWLGLPFNGGGDCVQEQLVAAV